MDQAVRDVVVTLITILAVAYVLYLTLGWLRRRRPDFAIAAPVAVAFALRILVAVLVAVSPFGDLGASDETSFLAEADLVIDPAPATLSWLDALTGRLHVFAFASQLYVLDSPDVALRILQGGIAVAGMILIAAAVYELAGSRAALIASWVIAVEPSNVLFSVVLHKEPNMMLAGGLVALGGAMLWKRGTISALLPVAAGCLIAGATRPYAGWFLIAAAAAITLHAGVRYWNRAAFRSLVMLSAVGMLAALALPFVVRTATGERVSALQEHQEATVAADSGSPLDLEQVDYSSPQSIALNLPQRMVDMVTRPYPWQVDNLSQRLGLLGNVAAWLVLLLLVREVALDRRRMFERAGPLIYVGAFLFVAYSLSAANAGTAFRYRTHLVAVAVALTCALWGTRTQVETRSEPARPRPAAGPLAAPGTAQ
jgi:hypothetical protein